MLSIPGSLASSPFWRRARLESPLVKLQPLTRESTSCLVSPCRTPILQSIGTIDLIMVDPSNQNPNGKSNGKETRVLSEAQLINFLR